MKNIKIQDYYKTSDLSLAAILLFFGYQIQEIENINYRRVVFLFLKDKKIDKLINDFWAKKLMVEPVKFFSIIKEIKARIYDRKYKKPINYDDPNEGYVMPYPEEISERQIDNKFMK